MNQKLWVLVHNQLTLYCHIQPGAKNTQLVGQYNQRLKIQLKAAPVDGKANKALIDFLAKLLKCHRSSIHLKSGANNRQKTLIVNGVTELPELLENLIQE